MARQLKAKLDLDTTEATRAARQFASSLRDTGQAGQSAMSGINGLLGSMGTLLGAAGVAGGVTALIGLYNNLRVAQEQSNAAVREALELENQRLAAVQAQNRSPRFDAARELTGMTAQETALYGATLSAETGYDADSIIQTRMRVNSLFGEEDQDAVMQDVMRFTIARGAEDPDASVMLAATLQNTYGITDTKGRQEGLNQAGAAASGSAYTVGDVAQIAASTASTAQSVGMGYQELLGTISGMSTFFASEPTRVRTAIEQMARAVLTADPAFLAKIGVDPDAPTLPALIDSLGKYLGEASDQGERVSRQREAVEAGIPQEVLNQFLRTSTQGYRNAYSRAMSDMGGSWWARDVEVAYSQRQSDTAVERARAAAEVADYYSGPEGSTLNAEGVLDFMSNAYIAENAQSINASAQAMVESTTGRELWDDVEPLEFGQARELVVLNAMSDRVLSALDPIARRGEGFGRLQFSPLNDVSVIARQHQSDIIEARRRANEHKFFGTQADQIPAFKNALNSAIAFLQNVRNDAGISTGEFTVGIGGVGGIRMADPSDIQNQQAATALESITPSSSAVYIQNQYNTTPSSIANNTATRTD